MATKIEDPNGATGKTEQGTEKQPTTQIVLSIVDGQLATPEILGQPLTIPQVYRISDIFYQDTKRRYEEMVVRKVLESEQTLGELQAALTEEGGETEDESSNVQPSG